MECQSVSEVTQRYRVATRNYHQMILHNCLSVCEIMSPPL